MSQTHTFHVIGMHCKSCVVVTERELKDVPYITDARSTLETLSVEVTGDFGEKSADAIADELTQVLAKHGYRLSREKPAVTHTRWSEFTIALPIAIAFAALFLILQKIGIVNIVTTNTVSYPTAVVIGIIASLSSCMAVVGGLLLSMSATFAKAGDRITPQLMFHGGRLVSFFLFGGLIGMLGAAFTLSSLMTFVLSITIGLVMLVLGVNLLDIFPWVKRLQPSMPKFISQHALGISKFNHTLTPLLVGIATFFLPCGFTQSMQLYTLTTGSFVMGSFTMLAFALGTLPVLALLSFSSLSITNRPNAGIFFKSAGLIVIMFALLNIINSLVVIGTIPPIFNF